MPYPTFQPGTTLFLTVASILLAFRCVANSTVQKNFSLTFSESHNSRNYTLYNRDTVQEHVVSGYVHRAANGDLVITVPKTASGRYKIRFFDQWNTLLFEIRQIRDLLLIVERYNFEHAGQFKYELYRYLILIENNNFFIRNE